MKTILPEAPVTFTPEQVAELHQKLRDMRHDINGVLAIIVGTLEVMRLYPKDAARFMTSLGQQPTRVENALKQFSADFEQRFGITKAAVDAPTPNPNPDPAKPPTESSPS
jgi:hypothetical protein